MQIIPIRTKRLKAGDNLAEEIQKGIPLHPNDILVVSSKAVATVEDAAINVEKIVPSDEAKTLSKEANQDPRFTELILQETKRMNGTVVGTSPYAILTSLKPTGMKTGRILCPNAGLDQSNIEEGFAIGWPRQSLDSTKFLWEELRKQIEESAPLSTPLAVLLSDSCVHPGRLGVVAFALVCIGLDPFRSEIGKKDLFGKLIRVTQEAVADQLATAANAVMGNTAQSTPAAVIRLHDYHLNDFSGWVDGIEPERDLFRGML